jgi:hypothetical protein
MFYNHQPDVSQVRPAPTSNKTPAGPRIDPPIDRGLDIPTFLDRRLWGSES